MATDQDLDGSKELGKEPGGKPLIPDTDALIDEIVATKGPYKYKDGFSEDNWEEEFEQIPLFMTKMPDKIDPVKGSAILALQDLKYQEDDPNCRALAYKEDGNEFFKKRSYTEAITAYTEGLKQGSTDDELLTILHCNRAAAHYYIGNMRSAINDATKAKSIRTDHIKAHIRGALAYQSLGKYSETIAWCDEGLQVDPSNQQLKTIRSKAVQEKKRSERDERKKKLIVKGTKLEQETLFRAMKNRNIRIVKSVEQAQGLCHQNGNETDQIDIETFMSNLTLSGSHPITKAVHLNEQDELIWPVIFLYPEYGQSEVVLEFNETSRFIDHIQVMFGDESAPWDLQKSYKPDTIQVWYEEYISDRYINIPVERTLGSVLSSSNYSVVSGTPSFILLVEKSRFCKEFLSKKRTSTL